jgi:hypothetical protein
LWHENGKRSDGLRFHLECPKSERREGCQAEGNKELTTGCYERGVLAKELDFQAQRGRLAEESEALNQRVIFYPKFHCELNFIERFWYNAKFYTRESCGYSLDALRKTCSRSIAFCF